MYGLSRILEFRNWQKNKLAQLRQLIHRHSWESAGEVDMVASIWPFRAPYMQYCKGCGKTRLRETRSDEI